MNAIVTPSYWEQATQELAEADELLAKLIAGNRPLHMRSRGDAFTTLARSIVVEHHRGKLEVASRSGQGSTFTIRLPIDARAEPVRAQAA